MLRGIKHIVLALLVPLIVTAVVPDLRAADPCVLAYPEQNAVFQFDTSYYRTIYPGDSLYDPAYDRYGVMLWDIANDRIAYELYQAPGLVGFKPATNAANSFDLPINKLTLYIDGFYSAPRQLNDIYVRFLPTPPYANPVIYVEDEKLTGFYYHIPKLVVSTPTGNGFYSDRIKLDMVWSGAQSMKITVFSDKNGNGVFDGIERYNVFMLDQTIPTSNATWGQIKAQYQE
jgi:hypothetical protein